MCAPAVSPTASRAAAVASGGIPAIRREPPIQLFARYTSVADVQSVIDAHDLGFFQISTFLTEQMQANPRLRGIVGTRLSGMIGTAIRWEPGRDNDLGRRAVRAIEEDWPLIASVQTRKQLHEWGLQLGVGFAQKHWYRSRTTGRLIPRVEVFHPSWTAWNWGPRLYQIWTQEGTQYVPSPSLSVPGDEVVPLSRDALASGIGLAPAMQWVVHEPFGQHSWRRGLIHAGWSAWLGHEFSRTDMQRASEKFGLALLKLKYPKIEKDAPALLQLLSALRNLRSNGVLPMEQREDGLNFDVEALEYGNAGFDIIQRTKDSNATDLAVLYLGHNLTTEAKGGSYAAANVGDLIRGDIKADDAAAENATFHEQVIGDWAFVNFGDRELAPIAVYETDPPAINLTAAQTLQFVSLAVQALSSSKIAEGIDFEALLRRFRMPIKAGGIPQIASTPDAGPPLPSETKKTVARIVGQVKEIAQHDKGAALEAVEAWIAGTLKGLAA